jgi:Cu/Ag efflux protein CusF
MKTQTRVKNARRLAVACLAASTLTLAPPVLAQHHHEEAAPVKTQPRQAFIASGEGVVQKIDLEKGRLTLRHAPIPALGWPAMIMPFAVTDPALLQALKIGDTVEFDLKDEQTIAGIRKR